MRVLVTGAGGYIGSVLVPALLGAGHHVVALDTFRYGPTLAACAHDPSLEIIVDDACSAPMLIPLLTEVNTVIPLAAIVGAPACDRDPVGATAVNCAAIDLLCSLILNDQLIIYPNTNSGYGSTPGVATEETPLHPLSHYAVTKADGERAVLASGGISLRLGTVYGASPRIRLDLLVNDFVNRALRDRSLVLFEPDARRDYVHVRDVAAAFLHALDGHLIPGHVYNVASENFTKRQLCIKIAEHVPFFTWAIGSDTDPDQRDYEVSTAKLRATGWTPEYMVDDGIEELRKVIPTLLPSYRNA